MTHTIGPAVEAVSFAMVTSLMVLLWCWSYDVADLLADQFRTFAYNYEGRIAGFSGLVATTAPLTYGIVNGGVGGHEVYLVEVLLFIAVGLGVLLTFAAIRIVAYQFTHWGRAGVSP